MTNKLIAFLFLFLPLSGLQDKPETESFESAGKTGYKDGKVVLATGTWSLSDALLGDSEQDAKKGRRSVRIRNAGRLTLISSRAFSSIRISYAVYGHDGPSGWQLWLSEDEGKSFLQTGTTVEAKTHGLQTLVFPLKYTGKLRLEIRKVSGGANRINIDDVVFENHPGPNSPEIPVILHTANTSNTYTVPQGDNSNLLLGNPSAAQHAEATADNYLIDQGYYTESYNKKKGCPNWVSWHIGKTDLGTTDRLNNFRPDSAGLPQGWYKADNTSYRNSGFDKGHNCPSADRTSSTAANSATFLMDNIIPQAPNNNQHTWEHLEAYCRDQVRKGMEVYVIMGSYGTGGSGKNGFATSIDHGRINVPAHIWKVVLVIPEGNGDLQRINVNTRLIAIDTPNDNGITPNWMNYRCTVRDIEKATGYDILSALPKQVQEVIETKKFEGGN